MNKRGLIRNIAIAIGVVVAFFGLQYSLASSRPPAVQVRNDTAASVEVRGCNHGPLLRKKVNIPPNRSNDLYPKGNQCPVYQDDRPIGCLAIPEERHPKPTVLASTMKPGSGC